MPPFPYLEFTISIGTWDWGSEGYVDSGFEGAISIPAALEHEIDAEPDYTPLRLADGALRMVPTWSGAIWLGDHRFPVEIVGIGRRCLIGREVLDQLEVCFKFGREVTIRFGDD